MTSTTEAGAEEVVIVQASRLFEATVEALMAHGATRGDAEQQATVLVEGDLRGHHSHGVRRLPILAARLDNGLIATGVTPEFRWTTDSALEVDGKNGFGPTVANAAIDRAVERAATTGLVLVSIANSNHIGMLAPYLERIVDAGDIALGITTSEALVHPWGGARAMVGTNPIGIGVPSEGGALVLDMSTASVSMGKILEHASKGIPLGRGWAVDAQGEPTEDAQSALDGGAISPFGGPKGYALGLALEALVATLTRSSLGEAVRGTLDAEHESTKGDVFLVISPERLGVAGSLPEVRRYFDEVRASGGPDRTVTVPGDRARTTRRERELNGIPLHGRTWQQVLELQKVGSLDA